MESTLPGRRESPIPVAPPNDTNTPLFPIWGMAARPPRTLGVSATVSVDMFVACHSLRHLLVRLSYTL